MNLKDDKQQNFQIELDFSSALTGEAREAGREGTEPSGATNGTENPASTNRLICPLLTSAPRSDRLSTASVAEATRSRSPGVSSTAFRAQPPDLRFAPLMDMDFAVSCPLVRR